MSGKSDCLYLKQGKTQCTDGKKTSVIQIIRQAQNGGSCPFTDGQEIKEDCKDSDCDKSLIDYKMAIKCILKDLIDTFIKVFNDGPGNCSQDAIVKQNMTVFIGPDADLGKCKVNVGQKIDLKSKKICLDINSKLLSLGGSEKEQVLKQVLEQTFDLQPKYVKDRPKFMNLAKELIFKKLMEIDSSVNSKCSQSISISQDQNVYLLGTIKCKDSTFNISQEAIVDAFMSCITSPFLDDLEGNGYLKKLYEQSLSQDCVYDLILTKPCDGKTRQYKVDILQPAVASGKCLYTQNQLVDVPCLTTKCKVSGWSEWSPCVQGEQMRERKMIVPGDDCPSFTQKRGCISQLRKRKNSDQDVSGDREIRFNDLKGYEWLYFGPKVMSSRQKKIAFIIVVVLVIIWVYTLFL